MIMRPETECLSVIPTIPVPDIESAVAYYCDRLGFQELFQWGEPPSHAAVALDQATIHFTLGAPEARGFWLYLHVDNVDELFQWYLANDVTLMDEPQTYEWGMREFNLRDLNGYQLRMAQSDLKVGNSIPVERVDRKVRLEKRLASLLDELAQHKGLSVGETLEEVLLHSFEALPNREGQGVASPHTKRTLTFIAELKKKHGIDYGTHDAYRFREL